ncbi:hypothetical protein FQZ97_1112700 [compost metagenome]
MQAEYRQLSFCIREGHVVGEGRRVGGQRQHAAQRSRPAQVSGVQHHGAALGEAGQDDALRVDAGVDLRLYQVHHMLR